jgi:hypothetical protein
VPRVRRGTVKSRAKAWEYSTGDPPPIVNRVRTARSEPGDRDSLVDGRPEALPAQESRPLRPRRADELGRPRIWDDLKYSHVRELWLRLAKRFVASGQGGPAWTERCVVILLQVGNWLFLGEKIERAVPVRKAWREQMRRELGQLTYNPIILKDLRHTPRKVVLSSPTF